MHTPPPAPRPPNMGYIMHKGQFPLLLINLWLLFFFFFRVLLLVFSDTMLLLFCLNACFILTWFEETRDLVVHGAHMCNIPTFLYLLHFHTK